MGSTKETLCRYYLHGCCKNGANCRFSHDRTTLPSLVCKFWLAGVALGYSTLLCLPRPPRLPLTPILYHSFRVRLVLYAEYGDAQRA